MLNIFALGILLIELYFQNSIEQLRTAQDPPMDMDAPGRTRSVIAKRLIDGQKVYQERGLQYEKAVQRCIFCDPDQDSSTLNDEGLRRAVDENVVALLEEDLRAFDDLC
jgi:hypothetical protein